MNYLPRSRVRDRLYGGAGDRHLARRKVFLHSKQRTDTDSRARKGVAVITVCYRVGTLKSVNSSF